MTFECRRPFAFLRSHSVEFGRVEKRLRELTAHIYILGSIAETVRAVYEMTGRTLPPELDTCLTKWQNDFGKKLDTATDAYANDEEDDDADEEESSDAGK